MQTTFLSVYAGGAERAEGHALFPRGRHNQLASWLEPPTQPSYPPGNVDPLPMCADLTYPLIASDDTTAILGWEGRGAHTPAIVDQEPYREQRRATKGNEGSEKEKNNTIGGLVSDPTARGEQIEDDEDGDENRDESEEKDSEYSEEVEEEYHEENDSDDCEGEAEEEVCEDMMKTRKTTATITGKGRGDEEHEDDRGAGAEGAERRGKNPTNSE